MPVPTSDTSDPGRHGPSSERAFRESPHWMRQRLRLWPPKLFGAFCQCRRWPSSISVDCLRDPRMLLGLALNVLCILRSSLEGSNNRQCGQDKVKLLRCSPWFCLTDSDRPVRADSYPAARQYSFLFLTHSISLPCLNVTLRSSS